MQISGIEASAPYDSTLSTSIYTYTGMMDAAAQVQPATHPDKNFDRRRGGLHLAPPPTTSRSWSTSPPG
jgi:hypothetical protein